MHRILLILLLFSCNTIRKAEKKIKSAYKHHPEVVAKFLNDSLPCVTTRIDTIVSTELEYITIKCPDNDYGIIDTIFVTSKDTQLIQGSKVIAYQKKYITIDRYVRDSAEVIKYKIQLKSCTDKLIKASSDNLKLQDKIRRRTNWILYLIIALLLSIIVNIIKLK